MDNSLKSLKKFGKSFYWAGMILPDFYLKRSADLYYFCRNEKDCRRAETDFHSKQF